MLLLVALATTLPLIQRANRSLAFVVDHDPYQSSKASISSSSQHQQPAVSIASYDDDNIATGLLSNQPRSYFHSIQEAIDTGDLQERCERYGFSMMSNSSSSGSSGSSKPQQRRIFYGSLIADEPWELFEIVAAETYGIFSGMVFVESNRTQNSNPRPFRRTPKHLQKLKDLFGMPLLQIRRYVNEDTTIDKMAREHRQRQEILKAWKNMGMTGEDIGYIADADETFSRDFFRAIQTCPYVEALDYESHHCFNPKVKIAGYTRMFETSPECLTKSRTWYHPDMIVGACIELIGNETLNPPAPRIRDYLRAPGFAHNCETRSYQKYQNSFGNITGNHYPLWSAADFRRQCGGHNYPLTAPNHTKYTAYHFHNFFADLKATRRKYKTYGHPVKGAMTKRLEIIGDDLKMLVRCVRNWTDAPYSNKGKPAITETQQWQREVGGLQATLPPWPIYFMDPDYRLRKHKEIQEKVKQDEARRYKRIHLHPREQEIERLTAEAQESRRQMWAKEAQAEALREEHLMIAKLQAERTGRIVTTGG